MAKELFSDLTCEQVSVTFNGQPLLQNVDLHIDNGERVAVIGPNAAGKSTLLKAMSGEIAPSCGQVLLNGMKIQRYPLKQRARILTKVPQRIKLLSAFSVRDYVAMGRYPYRQFTRKLSGEDLRAINQAMQYTHLESLAERSIQELSGGEQQRVLLAQALAQETSLLLLDEPNSYLDLRYELTLMDMLMRLNQESGLTVVIVLHDLNLAAAFAERVILLDQGRPVGDGKPWEILTEANIKKVYGVEATQIELPDNRQLYFKIGHCS